MGEGLRHTYLTGAWHYCSRCDKKAKIEGEMQWQRGLLLCLSCVDKQLLGEREIAIASVLEDGREELAPVEKLRLPYEYTETEDFI